ncbi:MAG TPA: hypothetical protein VJN02_04290 [Gammaproteobacteria bacterium]|nr:hypothetical protein [Gammaproteobacteria bacterium]
MIKVAIILYHTGETRALIPTMRAMARKSKDYEILIVIAGEAAAANVPEDLRAVTKVLSFIGQGRGSNKEYLKPFEAKDIQEVLNICEGYDHFVIGYPSEIQRQIAQALSSLPHHQQVIIYFDAGSNPDKIRSFAPLADVLIFTSHLNQKRAQAIVNEMDLIHQPEVIAARHGDFDVWLRSYVDMQQDADKADAIRKELNVGLEDKVILWVGGYGKDYSSADREAVSFRRFIDVLKGYPEYKLRITAHPGVKSSEKKQEVLNTYYLKPLSEAGFSAMAIEQAITAVDTREVVCALGENFFLISAGSTAAAEALYAAGVRTKNFIVGGQEEPAFAIKNVEKEEDLSRVLERWKDRKRFITFYRGANSEGLFKEYKEKVTKLDKIKKLGIPEASTKQVLLKQLLKS